MTEIQEYEIFSNSNNYYGVFYKGSPKTEDLALSVYKTLEEAEAAIKRYEAFDRMRISKNKHLA